MTDLYHASPTLSGCFTLPEGVPEPLEYVIYDSETASAICEYVADYLRLNGVSWHEGRSYGVVETCSGAYELVPAAEDSHLPDAILLPAPDVWDSETVPPMFYVTSSRIQDLVQRELLYASNRSLYHRGPFLCCKIH